MKNSIIEIWQDIPLYEGEYQASSFGRIRSLKFGKIKVLRPGVTKGYYRVQLSKDGKAKNFSVHSLIYTSFKGPIPPGMTIDHINNVSTDNRPENLQLLTPAENTRKAHLGKPGGMKGKNHSPASKAKVSAKLKGKKKSDEHRAKISAARKGRKHSVETRAKMNAAKKGKKLSDEHRAKIATSSKGKKLSADTRAKMRASQQARREREKNAGKNSH